MVRDVLGFKSPQTLIKRANSMVRYLSFLRAKGVVPPGLEAHLYPFFAEEKEHEAIRFSEHVLGLDIAGQLLSKRCLGAARQRSDAPVQLAAPLKVLELEALHSILADETDIWDRCMSGSFLCCVYTRSRWMDLQHSNWSHADPDSECPASIELSITEFKTKNANSWKGGLLAAVAPSTGVTSDNCGKQWFDVREAVGAPLNEGFPLMPAPSMEGQATKRPIGTPKLVAG